MVSLSCVSHARDCSRGLKSRGMDPTSPFQMSLQSESLTRSLWYMCLELATKLIFSFRKLTENNLLPRAKAWVCDEPWNLWIQRGCRADLPGRLGTWSSDGFATSNPNWRSVKEIHKNDRLSELMYSEEAQTFYFKTLPRSIGDHVVAAEHLPCFSYPPVTRLAGKAVNSYLSAGFILPTIFLYIFFPQNPVWKSKRIQKVWNASLVWGGRHLQQQQMGCYTVSRFGWVLSPTWIQSRFSFSELNFLSGVDFRLLLDVMGDFCIYFMYRR